LEGENEWEEMIWDGLRVSIDGVERVRGEGSRYDPSMMRLMKSFINERVM